MPAGKRKKATFNIDPELHRLLEVEAAVRRVGMVTLVEEALTHYLHNHRTIESRTDRKLQCTSMRSLGQQCSKQQGHDGYHCEGNEAWA